MARKGNGKRPDIDLPERKHGWEKLTPQQYADALWQSSGVVGAAAKLLGVNRSTVQQALKRYPELQEIREKSVENNLDLAESGLYRALGEEAPWAIKAYLGYHGHRRGLVTRSKVDLDPPPVPDLSKYPTERIAKALRVLRGEEA